MVVNKMHFQKLKKEHLVGKIIKDAVLTDENVYLYFTDGSEANIDLVCSGYGNYRLDHTYWYDEDEWL